MDNKFVLRLTFVSGKDVSYGHYVLDKKYLRYNLSKDDLKCIPEICLIPETFAQITDICCFSVCNDVEL